MTLKTLKDNRFLRTYGRLVGACAAILLAILIGAIVKTYSDSHKQYTLRSACSILTPQLARSVSTQPLQTKPYKAVATAQNRTTYCVYRGADSSVSLAVRSPKNAQGASLNQQAFVTPTVASLQVNGYGDKAYWTPAFGQLNILKDDQWFILSNGSNNPKARTLSQTKKLADKIINRL